MAAPNVLFVFFLFPLVLSANLYFGSIKRKKHAQVRNKKHELLVLSIDNHENVTKKYDQRKIQKSEKHHRVLITGISGMIGSHVARSLILHNQSGKLYTVYGLVRPRSDLSALHGVLERITLLKGDLTDASRMIEVVASCKPDYVYHFGAQAINGISFSMPKLTFDVNIEGTYNLLEAIRVNNFSPKVLVAGSSTEYGRTANLVEGPLSEDAPTNPISPYGISKLASEKIANLYYYSYKIPTITARLFIHVGVGGTDSLAIHEFCRQIALAECGKGPRTIMHGRLSTSRDMTDARDSSPILIKLLEHGTPGEAYNVGSGTTMTISDLLDIAVGLSTMEIHHEEDPSKLRSFDESLLVANNSKLVRLTGWKPSTNMDDTVLSILNYWRSKISDLYEDKSLATTNGCAFDDMDLFLPLHSNSFPVANLLFNSIAVFMPCWNTFHLVVDTIDAAKAVAWSSSLKGLGKVVIHPFDYPLDIPNITSGYIFQAWVMLWADKYAKMTKSGASYMMFLDSDAVFGMPVTCGSIFDDKGKIYQASWDIDKQPHFQHACLDILGTACDRSYMSTFPFTMPVDSFSRLRDHAVKKLSPATNISFNTAFNLWAGNTNWGEFSQFVVMGEYMRQFESDLVSQIYCQMADFFTFGKNPQEGDSCISYIPNAAHFGWGYNIYLGGGGGATYRNGNTNEKYGPEYIAGAESLILHGFCLMNYFEFGSTHHLCDGIPIDEVPHDIDLYSNIRKLPPLLLQERFTPEKKSSLCKVRV